MTVVMYRGGLGPEHIVHGDEDDPLDAALRALNKAAYDAVRAGMDTTAYPMLDRHTLRELCTITDRLVDDHAATGSR